MTPKRIQEMRELTETEKNPNVLARALGRLLDDYVFEREYANEQRKKLVSLLSGSFLTCESGGEGYFVKAKFADLRNAQALHGALVNLMAASPIVQSDSEKDSPA